MTDFVRSELLSESERRKLLLTDYTDAVVSGATEEERRLAKQADEERKKGQRQFHDDVAEVAVVNHKKNAGQATSSSGFPKGAVFSGEVPRPKR